MAVKDFNGNENQDHEAKKPADEKADESTLSNKNKDSKEVKNAHASGDGSFGRSESSLPDEEAKKKQGNSNY